MIDVHLKRKKEKVASIITFLLAAVVLAAVGGGCAHAPSFRYSRSPEITSRLAAYTPRYPDATFVAVSDLHLHDRILGMSGPDFTRYVENERKLIEESVEILDTFIDEIARDQADFVLVSGDLTKDGERLNHERVVSALRRIEAQGKKVFVINGNHDVNNGIACRYTAAGREPAATVTAEEFASLYAEFGYAEALSRDADSLSFTAEPVPGLWLVALDVSRYRENKPGGNHLDGGRLRDASAIWLEDRLLEASAAGKAVIVMVHQGVLEHFPGQERNFPDFVIESWREVSSFLAAYKVRLAFTGHFHAQDIVLGRNEKDPASFLFDIETGSLVTHPSPYRLCAIRDGRLEIASRRIESIPSNRTAFAERARSLTAGGLKKAALETMLKYGVPAADANTLAPQIVDAFMAHYAGDERLRPGRTVLTEKGLSFMGGIVVGSRRELVYGLWNDQPPADNDLSLNLLTGEFLNR